MKSKFIILSLLAIILAACSSDDDSIDQPAPQPAEANIVLSEIEYLGDRIELFNAGTDATDVSGYFLCLGPGTYRSIGSLTVVSGQTIIQPGEFLVITYDQINTASGQINGANATGGLGLYVDNSDFTDASTLADFVQWGAAGSVRETVAVQAGEWTAGEFVAVVEDADNSIIFDGEGNTAADFAETTAPSFGSENGDPVAPVEEIIDVVLNEVEYLGDRVELFNAGNVAVDVSEYFLCLAPTTYRQIGNLPVEGDLTIQPGAFLVITYDQLNVTAGQINAENGTGGLGLYTTNSDFADPSTLVDFVQWGAGGSFREDVAVAAGQWIAGEFIEVVESDATSLVFDGDGNAAGDWAETITPSFGAENGQAVAPEVSVVLNEIEFLGDRVELLNNGNLPIDVSEYFLCLAPTTYRQIGNLPVEGNLIIQPGEFLVVTYDQINVTAGQINEVSGTGGLGLYTTNAEGFGLSAAANLADFVQWGAGGSFREDVAVAAGQWTAGEFVIVTSDASNSIIFDGDGDAAADWAETTVPSFGAENGNPVPPAANPSVVINEVAFNTGSTGGQVEIFNNGNVDFDLADHWLCLGSGTYVRIGTLTPVSGNINLAPGEYLVIDYASLNRTAGGFGLYNASAFGSSAALIDFVQWGAAGQQREPVAVGAQQWVTNDVVPAVVTDGNTLSFDGNGDRAANWSETAPTLGAANN